MKNILNKNAFILFGWAFMLIISSPMYYHVKWGYGDLLLLEQFVIDIFEHSGDWRSWSITPSPAIIPDMFLYIFGYFTLDYAMDRIFFLSIMHAIFIVLAVQYAINPLLNKKNSNVMFFVLLVVSVVSYSSYTTNMFMYFNATNNHIGSFLLSLICIGLILRIYKKVTLQKYISLTIITALAIVSGQMFLIWFFVPMLVTILFVCICFFLVNYKGALRKINWTILTSLLIGGGISKLISPYVIHWDSLITLDRSAFPLRIEDTISALKNFIDSSVVIFVDYDPAIYFLLILWLASFLISIFSLVKFSIIITYYYFNNNMISRIRQKKFISLVPDNNQNIESDYLILFLCIFNIILVVVNFVSVIAVGEFSNTQYFRYFMLSYTMPIIITVILGVKYNFFLFKGNKGKYFLVIIALIALVFFISNFDSFKDGKNITDVRTHAHTNEFAVTKCVDNIADKYHLKYGLANFWHSRPVTLLSKKGLRVYPLFFSSLSAWHYMGNIDWFFGREDYAFSNPEYNFVITHDPFLPKHIIIKQMGEPTALIECEGLETQILIYDEATNFDKMWKAMNRPVIDYLYFKKGIINKITYTAEYLKLLIGIKTDGNIESTPDVAGFLNIGPFVKLNRGRYKAIIHYYTKNRKARGNIGILNIFYANPDIMKEEKYILSEQDDKKHTMEVSFNVEPSEEDKLFQIRVFSFGKGIITLEKIVLERAN